MTHEQWFLLDRRLAAAAEQQPQILASKPMTLPPRTWVIRTIVTGGVSPKYVFDSPGTTEGIHQKTGEG